MEKTMKLGEVMGLGAYLVNTEDVFDDMKLNAKSIYNILKLKKAIVEKFGVAQETLSTLAKNYGAIPIEGGQGMQVPEEKLEEFNKDYTELMKEEILISYAPLEISATSECSAKFMEAFFDFILITD